MCTVRYLDNRHVYSEEHCWLLNSYVGNAHAALHSSGIWSPSFNYFKNRKTYAKVVLEVKHMFKFYLQFSFLDVSLL